MATDRNVVWFMRGALAMAASNRQLVRYEELRRLCRLSMEQMGEYLDEARKDLRIDEPDFNSIVVNSSGTPGDGWGDSNEWSMALADAHEYWKDRKELDNEEFEKYWSNLPSYPFRKK